MDKLTLSHFIYRRVRRESFMYVQIVTLKGKKENGKGVSKEFFVLPFVQ